MKKRDLWVVAIMMIMAGLAASCEIGSSDLGDDLLPTDDEVSLLYDTIVEISAYPVTGKSLVTSETRYRPDVLMLLGGTEDTIVGSSVASIVTQFNTTSGFKNGPNMEIDTLMLMLHMSDYIGDMEQELTIGIHEFTERIYFDSLYKSDYDMEGKYNPLPLLEKSVLPAGETTFEFIIEDPDFIDKWLAIEEDTNYFRNDSIFKDYFNGFYISAHTSSPEGGMARILLNNSATRLSMKYANDSTEVDSTAERDFVWAHFMINEYSSQKINGFEHDHSGTYLSTIMDDETVNPPVAYVQGMAGVNTRFTFDKLEEWMEKSPIAINSATLVFEVMPEEESGILYKDMPDRLMTGTILEDYSFEPIYDFLILKNSNPNADAPAFGGYFKADSKGMFDDTTYVYRFEIPLHFQNMVEGAKPDNDFILQLDDGRVNPRITKLWSNLPATNQRIRLEIVYLKL
ncbi:MAG: DUF4270 family protein [Bacteroidota bacterium]